MSPPIYTPDGNEVSEIVLPDGSTASQVIGPDGNVVFEAVPDIPDSLASHRYPTDAGSGTILADSIASLDGSISGATWVSGAGNGGFHLDYDGSSDTTDLGTASQSEFTHFTENGKGTVAMWINPDSTSSDRSMFTSGRSTNDVAISFEINSGSLQGLLGDGSGSYMAVVSGGSIGTGSWLPVAMIADGSTLRLFAGDPISEVANGSISGGTTSDLTNPVEMGNSKFDGGIDDPWTATTEISQSGLQTWVENTSANY